MPDLKPPSFAALLVQVADRARAAGVFAAVQIIGEALSCEAKDSAAPAQYRLVEDAAALWVELVTADRWLSQSIEQDLVHTGDKLTDLLDEELVELGDKARRLPVEHFRSEDRLYTFRSSLPSLARDAQFAGTLLLAYEACFRRLGDMEEKVD